MRRVRPNALPPDTRKSVRARFSELMFHARRGVAIMVAIALPSVSACSSGEPEPDARDAGGRADSQPPTVGLPPSVVFNSGAETMTSAEYQLDVWVGGPVGKGRADSPQFVLDYDTPYDPGGER